REHTFSKVDRNGFGFSSFEKYSFIKDPKNNYLHEGHQLVARCKATVSYNEIQIQSFPVKDGINSESKFKSNQKSLLDSGELSDFTIVVGTTEIPVHKCVLSAHSPFFKAMFSHDCTKEAQEKKVIIPDVSIDAMKDFLQFIYTGVKPQNGSLSPELLTLADKYQVGDLKYLCADYLSSVLTIDNVANVYLVADLHNASGLKDNCLAFMASNFSQVLLSQGWLQICKTGGEKITEVCSVIGDILRPKKTSSKDNSEEYDSDEVPE
ncbi:PREDICTED: speckle-type POZ protein-like, partial [Rhagoletis zephyria]|uniref:speckle-type POZ protein-like n=1 Tax=Rhagoletis zephyria TaxID=28612 RepID=UPI000811891E